MPEFLDDEQSLRPYCHYCGAPKANTRDHIVPRAWGGPDEGFNIVPACGPCNTRKADSLPTCPCEKCLAAMAWYRKQKWPFDLLGKDKRLVVKRKWTGKHPWEIS